MNTSRISVLHVSPHPDDEAIAAPATLLALRDAGHKVTNLLVSLGRPADRRRRKGEAKRAAKQLGLELLLDKPLGISRADDLDSAQGELARMVRRRVDRDGIGLVVGPSPHDGHHGHEVVGRGIRDALGELGDAAPRWWMWGLWADLPLPTLYVPFDEKRLRQALKGLDAYRGELDRNDYTELVRGRAKANRVLGSERVFGFGSGAYGELPFAELLTEVVRAGESWHAAAPRALDPADPLPHVEPQGNLGWWVEGQSFGDRMRAERP